MLKSLFVKNFALIRELEIDFASGFNIITGETGAGKSIIVDALMLALGERGSADFVRQGEKKAIIEAHFFLNKNNPLMALLEEEDYDIEGGELIVRRELLAKGTSRCFLNDTPVPVNALKSYGDYLVDFHGQHDHQLILKKDSHIGILDIVAHSENELQSYSEKFAELKSLITKYKDLNSREKSLKDKKELQTFEISEIEKISPVEGEEAKLESELRILENSENLFSGTGELYAMLYENDDSVRDRLVAARKKMEGLSVIDDSFEEYSKECNSALISIDEISKFIKDYNSTINFDPVKIEEIRERLHELQGLRKKYGTYDAIFEKWEQLKEELSLITNFDAELNKLRGAITLKKIELGRIAGALSKKRQKAAKVLEKNIVASLVELGIPNSAFETRIKDIQAENTLECLAATIKNCDFKAFSNGIDKVEFYISTNKGEKTKPLAEVASGGEISRIMLSIKSVVAESDSLPILVFDEIDTGISGRIARKTGLAMQKLARNHQIIAITHLPQIAALGDNNISVSKKESSGRSEINAGILSMEMKLNEVAKLISGDQVTETALKSAQELTRIKN